MAAGVPQSASYDVLALAPASGKEIHRMRSCDHRSGSGSILRGTDKEKDSSLGAAV